MLGADFALQLKQNIRADDVLGSAYQGFTTVYAMQWMQAMRKTQYATRRGSHIHFLDATIAARGLGGIVSVDEKACGAALKVVIQENQARHHAKPVGIGVDHQLSVDDATAGPRAIRMEFEKIAHSITIEAKPGIQA